MVYYANPSYSLGVEEAESAWRLGKYRERITLFVTFCVYHWVTRNLRYRLLSPLWVNMHRTYDIDKYWSATGIPPACVWCDITSSCCILIYMKSRGIKVTLGIITLSLNVIHSRALTRST